MTFNRLSCMSPVLVAISEYPFIENSSGFGRGKAPTPFMDKRADTFGKISKFDEIDTGAPNLRTSADGKNIKSVLQSGRLI